MQRWTACGRSAIPLIQFEAGNFVNVALEVFEDIDLPVDVTA
jgi:hypothetical protein